MQIKHEYVAYGFSSLRNYYNNVLKQTSINRRCNQNSNEMLINAAFCNPCNIVF